MTNRTKDSRKVLILDDDPTFGQVMQRQSRRYGVDVIYCQTIREFVDQALGGDFSVALVDYNLPEFSGEQVAKIVEGRPVYIISSDDRIAERTGIWTGAIKGFISKRQLSSSAIMQFIKQTHFSAS